MMTSVSNKKWGTLPAPFFSLPWSVQLDSSTSIPFLVIEVKELIRIMNWWSISQHSAFLPSQCQEIREQCSFFPVRGWHFCLSFSIYIKIVAQINCFTALCRYGVLKDRPRPQRHFEDKNLWPWKGLAFPWTSSYLLSADPKRHWR